MPLAQEVNLAVPLVVYIPAVVAQVVLEMRWKLKTHHRHIHQNHLVVSFSGFLLKVSMFGLMLICVTKSNHSF